MASVNGHGLFQRRLPPTLDKAIPFVRLRYGPGQKLHLDQTRLIAGLVEEIASDCATLTKYSGISAEEPRTHNAALLVGIPHGTNLQFTYTISLD